jgi:hypothetical protein
MMELSPQREDELVVQILRDRVGIDPQSLRPILRLAALGLVNSPWRNTHVEDWHAEGRIDCGMPSPARTQPAKTSPPPPAAAVKQRKQHTASACQTASPARLTEGLRVPQERIDRVTLADTSWWHPADM